MEFHVDRNDAPALPSATVLMLRDGPQSVEVFLLKRHNLSDVLGGAYVFPGGKVDREDADLAESLDEPAAVLQAALGEHDLSAGQAAALYVAAIREVFEESGVLFAHAEPAGARMAWDLMREGRRFDEVLAMLGLRLAATALAPWSRWVTPQIGGVLRKRFDTRFFVAASPAGQEPVHDDHEAVDSAWLDPRLALQQHLDGQIQLAPPQIMTLAHIARHANVASVMADARSRQPQRVMPEGFEADGQRVLCFPGDERHSVPARAMPGPVRLYWRDGRFGPHEGGLDALIG